MAVAPTGNFTLITTLFNKIDFIINNIVSTNVSNIITLITPIIGIGMMMSLMIEGLMMVYKAGSEDALTTLLVRFVKWAIVLSVATAGGLYQQYYVNTIQNLPDSFSSYIVSSGKTTATGTAALLDGCITRGLSSVMVMWHDAGVLSSGGLASLCMCIAMAVSLALMSAITAGTLLMTKVLLSIYVILGPIFILSLMFSSTTQFFSRWLSGVIKFSVTLVILSIVIGIIFGYFEDVVTQATVANGRLFPSVVSMVIMTVVGILIMKEVPTVAAGLGDGASIAMRVAIGGGAPGGGAPGGGGGGLSSKAVAQAGEAGARAAMSALSAAGPAGTAAAAGLGAAKAASSAVRGLANK